MEKIFIGEGEGRICQKFNFNPVNGIPEAIILWALDANYKPMVEIEEGLNIPLTEIITWCKNKTVNVTCENEEVSINTFHNYWIHCGVQSVMIVSDCDLLPFVRAWVTFSKDDRLYK